MVMVVALRGIKMLQESISKTGWIGLLLMLLLVTPVNSAPRPEQNHSTTAKEVNHGTAAAKTTPRKEGTVWAEAQLATNDGYVQQTLIYTVRLVSRTNVLQISIDTPTIPGGALESLEDKPRSYTRSSQSGPLVVSEYRYALTVLNVGTLQIPPTRLSGKTESLSYGPYPNRQEQTFQVETPALRFNARGTPANALSPWLPLQALELAEEGGGPTTARVGEPYTISLYLRAMGMRGERLPTLLDRLQGPDFRVYPESAVEYWQDVNSEGNQIRGQRHEQLTVVPLRAGTLQLPPLRIPWWDTVHHRQVTLEWQSPPVTITGSPGTSKEPSPPATSGSRWWLGILPITGIAFLLGWWSGREQQTESFRERLTQLIQTAKTFVTKSWRYWLTRGQERFTEAGFIVIGKQLKERVIAKLSRNNSAAINFQEKIQPSFLAQFFYAWRLLQQVQAAEQDLEQLARQLQQYGHHALCLERHAPFSSLANSISQQCPEINGIALYRLLRQLEAAIYGEDSVDLQGWKERFRKLFRPALKCTWHHRSRPPRRGSLQPLNPPSIKD